MIKIFLQVFLLMTISFAVNAQQKVPGVTLTGDIGTNLGRCRGVIIVYSMIYIELGQQDTVSSLKYLNQLADNLSEKYVVDRRYYDQISAQEIHRFGPIAKRDNPKQAHADLNWCIKFLDGLKKMN